MTFERSYTVVLEPDPDGGFVVSVPALPEIHTQGETVEQGLDRAREAAELALEVRRTRGEEIPPSDEPRIERVNVKVVAA